MLNLFAKDTVKNGWFCFLLLFTCSNTIAASYGDVDNINVYLSATGLNPQGQPAPSSVGGSFYIGTDPTLQSEDTDGQNAFGYDPNSEYVTSARASFAFGYGDSESETVEILLSTSVFANVLQFQTAFISGPVIGNALFDLDEDGLLTYTITALSGDVTFQRAQLLVTTAPGSRPVPDAGSSLILLGVAAIGLGFIKSRSAV